MINETASYKVNYINIYVNDTLIVNSCIMPAETITLAHL